jgi:hypothetical protein
MSDTDQAPSWYNPRSVRETVQNGLDQNIGPTRIAAHLAEHDFDDVPIARVETIVEGMPVVEENSGDSPNLSQSPSTDAEPRDQLPKQLAVDDLEYVSNREAARLIGLALEQFDGNTVRPPGTAQVETDVVWHRQHMTVALRVVPIPSGEVGTSHVDALLDGTVVSDDTRSPSELAIVTNRSYTDEAKAYAAEHDIHCFDAGHVEAWFRRARIPMDAVGTVLEDGENHDGPLTDLVDIPPIPSPRTQTNPLDITRAFPIDRLDPGTEQDTDTERPDTERDDSDTGLDETAARDDPLAETQTTPGETGTLYADPENDGDYDAFDDYLEDI